jgi:hypothetical protein
MVHGNRPHLLSPISLPLHRSLIFVPLEAARTKTLKSRWIDNKVSILYITQRRGNHESGWNWWNSDMIVQMQCTNVVHNVPRMISYLSLDKCLSIPGKAVVEVFSTHSVSDLYGQSCMSRRMSVQVQCKESAIVMGWQNGDRKVTVGLSCYVSCKTFLTWANISAINFSGKGNLIVSYKN